MVGPITASPHVTIAVDGTPVSVPTGVSLAAALIATGHRTLRRSPRAGAPRGAFCLMGACQECVVVIDGRIARACMTEVRPGLLVSLRGSDSA
ncbi:(2Fe-2S)-binding protein [Elioraea sp.]|uniref:(2Fe-2S)-binding protein n=1 Tax=Elioraea sp. TaxID=2185103 RepID=UPI003F72A3FD